MEIIKHGRVKTVTYTVTCSDCETQFRFRQPEGKYVSDMRDGDYIEINCPVCNKLARVSVSLGVKE